MLKIKDDVDLNKLLEKYKTVIEKDDKCEMGMSIYTDTREIKINCPDSYYSSCVNKRAELLYDLIKANLVEKVEE